MQNQEKPVKRKNILVFTLFGAIGFGLGGAISGAIWPSIGQPYFGFIVMGAAGGASLGLVLKNWKRAFVSGAAGAFGFGTGSYSPNLIFSILAGIIGVSLGLAWKDWRRIGPLMLAGIIGFVFAIFNTWNLSSGEVLQSALMMAIWGIIGGGALGATLGYLEKKKGG